MEFFRKLRIKLSWERLFLALVIVQFAMAAFFNLAYTQRAVDTDSAKLFVHAMEMSKNNTLLIPDWEYTTTMEWDTAALLAIPFYKATGNVYLSFGIANILLLAFFVFVVKTLFERFRVEKRFTWMACSLFLIPYAFGMLDYFNMLFFNGSQYMFRVLLPLWMLMLLKTPAEKRKKPGVWVLAALFLVSVVLASVSSGTYIVVACIFPVVLLVIYDVLLSSDHRKYDRAQYVFLGITLLFSVLGMAVSMRLDSAGFGNEMKLLNWFDLRYYRDSCVEGFFRLFGAMPGEETKVLSVAGAAFLCKLFLVCAMVAALIGNVKRQLFSGKKENGLAFFLTGISLINFIILFCCETRYNTLNNTMEHRYYLVAVVPMLLAFPLRYQEWERKWSSYLKRVMSAAVPAGIFFVTVFGYYTAHENLDLYGYCDTLCAYFDTLDAKNIIFLSDRASAECCRLKDQGHLYSTYETDGYMNVVDYYRAQTKREYYEDRHVLVAVTGTDLAESLGEGVAAAYQYQTSLLWFDVYTADVFLLIQE